MMMAFRGVLASKLWVAPCAAEVTGENGYLNSKW